MLITHMNFMAGYHADWP